MTCIFCDILDGKRDGHLVYEDEDHLGRLITFIIITSNSKKTP